MPWDCLEDEINAEFSALELPDGTEDELWRRHRVRADKNASRMREQRAATPAPIVVAKCENCSDALPAPTKAGGRPARYCSNRCKNVAWRRRRDETPCAIRHEFTTEPLEANTSDRNA